MIDTREELVNALSEAAELEHGLLAQYLFAAFSLKKRADEGITLRQQSLIVDWEATLLQVAHQEMYHLASVCNLLSAIGGAPQFARPNFPQPMKTYYPFDFNLERFNDRALHRFIVFELPQGEPPPDPPRFTDFEKDSFLKAAPDPLIYNYIGELYGAISDGFERITEEELFIGPKPFQDVEDWGLRLKLHTVKDLASAKMAIREIVVEGEGTLDNRADANSHYNRFRRVRALLAKETTKDSGFDPARLVVVNPQTRKHRDAAGKGTLIEHKITRETAELFNDIYSTMLLMLIQYYSYGGETRQQREILRDSCRRLMSAVIRPLAEILTEMPVREGDADAATAGPGFEIYSGLRLAPEQRNRWTVLQERFVQETKDAQDLSRHAADFPVIARLNRVAEAMRGTLLNLTQEFAGDA